MSSADEQQDRETGSVERAVEAQRAAQFWSSEADRRRKGTTEIEASSGDAASTRQRGHYK